MNAAKVKDLTSLDGKLRSSRSADVRESWKKKILLWLRSLLERLVDEGCLRCA